MKALTLHLSDEQATVSLGNALAQAVLSQSSHGLVVYLNGDLGAGKTTLTRGFLQGMGHKGNVKSPTYTLVEPYELDGWSAYHFDLYRLGDPEELEYMGIRDYFSSRSCCFIEWPEKGTGLLAKADLIINISYQDEERQVELLAQNDFANTLLVRTKQYYVEEGKG